MRKIITLLLLLVPSLVLASAWSSVRKGVEKFEKEKYGEALESFRNAEMDDPDSPIIHYNLASALYKEKKYDKALEEYNKAVEMATGDELLAKIYYGMGNAYFQNDSLLRAIDAYKKSLEYEPDDEDAKYNLELARALVKELAEKKKLSLIHI